MKKALSGKTLIYDWNKRDKFKFRHVKKLELDDETLRDGLQSPSVTDPTIKEKIELLELMEELRARRVTLDICPTSNLQAGIGSLDSHAPLPRLLQAGVPVTISTDDRTVSDLTLLRELERAHQWLGLSAGDIVRLQRQAYAAAFLHRDEELRAGLQQGFEAWVAANPAPA